MSSEFFKMRLFYVFCSCILCPPPTHTHFRGSNFYSSNPNQSEGYCREYVGLFLYSESTIRPSPFLPPTFHPTRELRDLVPGTPEPHKCSKSNFSIWLKLEAKVNYKGKRLLKFGILN